MSIITISSKDFRDGRALAEQVSGLLGYRCIDREVLIQASKRYGIPQEKYEEALETEPAWWQRWFESIRLYRVTLQAAMCEVAQGGNLVYHGLAGHALFAGIHHVLRVCLVAPIEYRVRQVKTWEGLEENAARHYLKELDKIRKRRIKAIFDIDWEDLSQYDLAVNISQMTLATAAQLVMQSVRKPEYQPSPEAEQVFQDLILTAKVQAALVASARTRNLYFEVRTERGHVQISALVINTKAGEEILRVVSTVDGVNKITADIKPFSIYETYGLTP